MDVSAHARCGIILIVCALLELASVGCSREPTQSYLTIEPEVSPQPVRVGPATITIKLGDAKKNAVKNARVTLEGNMSHAGMSPVFSEAKEIEAGKYRSQLNLSMAGDWIVLVHVQLADGLKIERQFDIKNVTP